MTAIVPSTTEIQSLVQFPPASGGSDAMVVKTGGQINIESGGAFFVGGTDAAAALAVTEVSVLSQGADPTGVADSSAAFNAALAVATASGGGQYCKVRIPAGTYRINNQVNVENCSVIGDGRVNTFITVDQHFSSTATAVFNLTSNSLDAGPELRDFSIQFAQPSDQGTRANFLTLAGGGTSGTGGTGVQYPPAINAASNSSRYKLSGLRISRAWTGINSNGVNAVWWLDDIEMSALHIGFYANGTQDFSHIKGFHFWNFDIPTATALFTGVWEDGNTVAANIGRMDGLNVSDLTVFQARVQITPSFTFGQFENVMMDGSGSTFEIAGNNWLQINNIYFTGDATGANTNSQLSQTGGALTNVTNLFAAPALLGAVNISGGTLQISSGEISVGNPGGSAITQSGGALAVTGMRFLMNTGAGNWTVPVVHSTSGVIRFTGNEMVSPVAGTAGGLVLSSDTVGNAVVGNSFNGWGWTPPGNTGFYGANDVFTPMPAFFGTGADGNLTISSGTTTLGRDMCYNNVTISGTAVLNLTGFRIFVAGKLDISAAQAGAIISQGNGTVTGNAGSGATGGAAPSVTTALSLPASRGGPATAGQGGTGTTTAGGAGGNTSNVSLSNGGEGGLGGAGGASSTPNAGGGAGTLTVGLTNPGGTQINFPIPVTNFTGIYSNVFMPEIVWTGITGSGGGAGGGDGTHSGGGGGSAGQASDGIAIYAAMINRGTNITAGIISSVGGVGGAGAAGTGGTAGGGGGGGGAGGGFVYIVAGQLLGSTITNAIDVSGNTGGAGGNSPASGVGGTGGHGGACGGVQLIVLNPPSFTVSSGFNTAGSAATGASTTAGTAGGAGASKKVNL